MEMRGLRGLRSKSSIRLCSPIRAKASGKYRRNHTSIASRESRVSNSAVGANKVQVNDMSFISEKGKKEKKCQSKIRLEKGKTVTELLTLFGRAMSMKAWRGHMWRWF